MCISISIVSKRVLNRISLVMVNAMIKKICIGAREMANQLRALDVLAEGLGSGPLPVTSALEVTGDCNSSILCDHCDHMRITYTHIHMNKSEWKIKYLPI